MKNFTPGPYQAQKIVADTLIYTGKCILHTVTFQFDAATSTGTIDIYDGIDTNGVKIFSWTAPNATVFNPATITLDALCNVGIYVDYTNAADIPITVTFAQKN